MNLSISPVHVTWVVHLSPPSPRLPLHYVSAFAGMPTHADAARVEWSLSNALVGALQGHAGHWRAAPAANTLAPQPPQPGGAKP